MEAVVERPQRRHDKHHEALTRAKAHLLTLVNPPAGEPTWLVAQRQAAASAFAAAGLPSLRDEAFKYTNLAPHLDKPFTTAVPGAAIASGRLGSVVDPNALRLVFSGGQLVRERSRLTDLPRGLTLMSLREAITSAPRLVEAALGRYADVHLHGLLALNAASFSDGALVFVEAGSEIETPIQLVSEGAGEGTMTQLRHLVVVGANSRVEVSEHVTGAGFVSTVTEVALSSGAKLTFAKAQDAADTALQFSHLAVQQERDSQLISHDLALGSALARSEIAVALDGEGARAELYGLYMPTGERLHDAFTSIAHNVPHCTSVETYKGVLDDASRGVWTGKILVQKQAQKTAAEQSNKNLLLKDSAHVDARPQLEIYADDVKCSHGAAIGSVDDDALFYLRARGIGLADAKRVLTYAFASEVLDKMPAGPLHDAATAHLTKGLLEEGGGAS